MKIELNPLRWGHSVPTHDAAGTPLVNYQTTKIAATAEEKPVSILSKIENVLSWIGKGFEKGLVFAVKYAIPVEKLVAIIFPPAAAAATAVADATTLIQNAVLMVEQKYAASGAQNGTGAQKLAEVLTLTEQAVTSLLGQAGISADAAYITNIVNAVVAILNVQAAPTTAA